MLGRNNVRIWEDPDSVILVTFHNTVEIELLVPVFELRISQFSVDFLGFEWRLSTSLSLLSASRSFFDGG